MNKVAIGCIVRNRAWILPEYLQALKNINYPEKQFLFLENDSTDNTLNILYQSGITGLLPVTSIKTGFAYWNRSGYGINNYGHLAFIRNIYLEMFLLTDADYLLSIDSDVIVSPDIIDKLSDFADQKTIVGAAICNIPGRKLDGHLPGNFLIERGGVYIHPPEYRFDGVADVDIVGAVYTIPRRTIEDGVRYAAHLQGEDIPFCLSAIEKGYAIKVCFDINCSHRMIEPVQTVTEV